MSLEWLVATIYPTTRGHWTPLLDGGNSHHASLGDGKAEQDQEDTQNRSDLDGEAPRLALKGRTEG